MDNELKLLTTRNFNGVEFNCYGADGSNDGDFWATREQIGQLLGYSNPAHAIKDIHARHTQRLNNFSTWRKMSQVEGSRTVTREILFYSFRGLLEICRYSNQPQADAVMDFLYNIADEIRQSGFYATPNAVEKILNDPDSFIRVLQEVKTLRSTNTELQKQVQNDRPKVIFAEAVVSSNDSILINELSKLIRQNGIDIGEKRFFVWMREHGYLCKVHGENWNLPTQRSMENGWFEIKKTVINDPSRGTLIRRTPKVTGKGQSYFINGFLSGKFRL